MGLSKEAKRKPAQLSGGQQQRVALARALVNLPKVLLLDEPLGALDLKLRKALQVELKNIQRDVGITFVYVTHDQEEALTMSDRIAVMNEGRIEQCAGPEAVYEHPATTFVAGFIGVSNLMPAVATGGNEVKLDNGPSVTSPDAAKFSAGERCFAVVRPEKLEVTTDAAAPSDRPSIEGVVEASLYPRYLHPDGDPCRRRRQDHRTCPQRERIRAAGTARRRLEGACELGAGTHAPGH